MPLMNTLESMNFNEPTPIQAKTIPLALAGKDILGSAQTGTGKTGAFGIPLVAKLLNEPSGQFLVITPTRELANQVMKQLRIMLGRYAKVKTALLIGGAPMPKQLQQLKEKPRLIVGTPGRITDHLKRNSLKFVNVKYVVLDETDRMLDMGFSIQIDEIMTFIKSKHQTLLFSATLPANIVKVAKKYLNNPEQIEINKSLKPAENLEQTVLQVKDAEKYDQLIKHLGDCAGSVIIFMKTKHSTEKMAKKLNKEGFKADAIHGDLRQNKRDRVIRLFRQSQYQILVATDVASRGLDIPHIENVINYDLPQCPEDYIHRIGRTARAGAKGHALNLIAPIDKMKWVAINHMMNPDAPKPKPEKKKSGFKSKFKKTFKFKKPTDVKKSSNFKKKPRRKVAAARTA